MNASRTVSTLFGPALAALPVAWQEPGANPKTGASRQARPSDREAWARKLAGLNETGWRASFAVGQELAALPADEGFAILDANLKRISSVDSRLRLLKAGNLARHPRLVDALDLAMRDPSPGVQSWAASYRGDTDDARSRGR